MPARRGNSGHSSVARTVARTCSCMPAQTPVLQTARRHGLSGPLLWPDARQTPSDARRLSVRSPRRATREPGECQRCRWRAGRCRSPRTAARTGRSPPGSRSLGARSCTDLGCPEPSDSVGGSYPTLARARSTRALRARPSCCHLNAGRMAPCGVPRCGTRRCPCRPCCPAEALRTASSCPSSTSPRAPQTLGCDRYGCTLRQAVRTPSGRGRGRCA